MDQSISFDFFFFFYFWNNLSVCVKEFVFGEGGQCCCSVTAALSFCLNIKVIFFCWEEKTWFCYCLTGIKSSNNKIISHLLKKTVIMHFYENFQYFSVYMNWFSVVQQCCFSNLLIQLWKEKWGWECVIIADRYLPLADQLFACRRQRCPFEEPVCVDRLLSLSLLRSTASTQSSSLMKMLLPVPPGRLPALLCFQSCLFTLKLF